MRLDEHGKGRQASYIHHHHLVIKTHEMAVSSYPSVRMATLVRTWISPLNNSSVENNRSVKDEALLDRIRWKMSGTFFMTRPGGIIGMKIRGIIM